MNPPLARCLVPSALLVFALGASPRNALAAEPAPAVDSAPGPEGTDAATAPAPRPEKTVARYVSGSTLLFVPNALSLTSEVRHRGIAASIGGTAAFMPDLVFAGGWGTVGATAQVHLLSPGLYTQFEFAAGLDSTLLLTQSDVEVIPVAPTVFLGARWRRTRGPDGGMMRLGAELSLHSLFGLTVSIGREQPRGG